MRGYVKGFLKRFWFLSMALGLALPGVAQAQGPNSAIPPGAVDARIAATLRQISAARIQANIEKLVSFGTRATISAQDPESIAAGRGIGAAREWIKAEFERYAKECGGCLEVKTESFTEAPGERIPQPTVITNVYAVLKGTNGEGTNGGGTSDAQRIVLVTGHYDSRNSGTLDGKGDAPGANDDGSGTAVSLECARVLSKLKFPGTIIFLTVAGEEQGLNGSRHFAKMAKEQGWNLEAVLNNDIVGGDKSAEQDHSVVRVFSEGIPAAATEQDIRRIRGLGGESDSGSRQVARYIAEVGRTYAGEVGVKPMLVFRLDRYLRGGDHYSFNQEGFSAVRFTEFREDFHHQHQDVRTENGLEYGDLPKFVDFDYVANVARLNAATLAALAAAPAPPANVHLLAKELENDSTLTWDAVPGAAEYEVLWRATTSPEWEHALKCGNVTRATLKLSKDNVIFAVRAVDTEGHASLPVVPVPGR
ncbi:MAG: M28 family metallopeptidase [Candidatus Sulfotelmatobacter sp.]